MFPFNCTEISLSPDVSLIIIDIEKIDDKLKEVLDENLCLICQGKRETSLATLKKRVRFLYSTKNENWIMGATAEFFVHLYVNLAGFSQECLFLNLEENSIKKGFDGLYSANGVVWLMESKAGSSVSSGVTHQSKVKLAMQDLENKVAGKDNSGKRGKTNNPWQEAYSHASHIDVGTAEDIRKNIAILADDFTNGKYKTIEEFNTMPCGTVFLGGVWNPADNSNIERQIRSILNTLKGKQIKVICVTQKSTDLFLDYIRGDENRE